MREFTGLTGTQDSSMSSSSQDSSRLMKREKSFIDQVLEDSPYYRMQRERSFARHGGSDDKSYTPTLIARSPKREKTFYRAANFRDSSPGREKSGATNRSVLADSTRTSTLSTNSGGSRLTREGSFVRSTLTISHGIPDVPLAEAPTITTTDGRFRLTYNDQNKLSFRRIAQPEPPRELIRYNHDDLIRIRRFTAPKSPPLLLLRNREKSFINDAIVTEKKRTKYKDIIPVYNAVDDIHSKQYFRRPDVQRLLSVTTTVHPWEKDVKPEYLHDNNPY